MGLALTFAALPALAQLHLESAPRLSPVPVVPLSLPALPVMLPAAMPSLAAAAPSFAAPAAAMLPLAAAGEGPLAANGELSSVARAAAPSDDVSLPARSLNVFWDGLGIPARDDQPLDESSSDTGLLPQYAGSAAQAGTAAPWLALKNKKYAAALDAAVRLARSTAAGRRTLNAAEKALDGAALPLEVKELGRNYGEYDYLKGRMSLDRKLFAPGREAELAGTLAHELLHVAQHAQGLPSNALELEIEAHLLDLELLDELGVKPPKHTFARQAYDALRQGPKEFAALIAMAVPGSPYLAEMSFEEIADQMEAELESLEDRRGPKAVRLAESIAADLKSIKSPAGRRAYQRFSDRVHALLEARAAAAR